jgi:hypothetical protein
MAHS